MPKMKAGKARSGTYARGAARINSPVVWSFPKGHVDAEPILKPEEADAAEILVGDDDQAGAACRATRREPAWTLACG